VFVPATFFHASLIFAIESFLQPEWSNLQCHNPVILSLHANII
jgi:hypothetical protein